MPVKPLPKAHVKPTVDKPVVKPPEVTKQAVKPDMPKPIVTRKTEPVKPITPVVNKLTRKDTNELPKMLPPLS